MKAQSGPCTESAVKLGHQPSAEDAFSYMPPYGKPVVGKPAIKEANEKSFSDRTNLKSEWEADHRIVSSPTDDMAYEYGRFTCPRTARATQHLGTRSSKP
jgi:hypothetical protein